MPKQLLFVVLAVLLAQSALAQQFYRWMDQNGQWHYSDFPPSGVTAEKIELGDSAQKSTSQLSVPSAEQKKTEDESDRPIQPASDADPLRSARVR